MSNVNGILLKHLFQLIESESQDEKLLKSLEESVKKVEYPTNYSTVITFDNGVIATVSSNLDIFNIDLSNGDYYLNEDNKDTPMGYDRVVKYLRSICRRST